MKQIELIEYILKIEKWANDRNLIKGSTPEKQTLKLMEEFGEMCSGIIRNDEKEIKDAIGDCFIGLVILSKQLNVNHELLITGSSGSCSGVHSLAISLGKLCFDYINNVENKILTCARKISRVANIFNFTIEECVMHAYEQIKDRKGRMIDGVFIKESDLGE